MKKDIYIYLFGESMFNLFCDDKSVNWTYCNDFTRAYDVIRPNLDKGEKDLYIAFCNIEDCASNASYLYGGDVSGNKIEVLKIYDTEEIKSLGSII